MTSLRHQYLVSYDIREPKRLRTVHKILDGYGDATQYSVFFCNLSPAERLQLEFALVKVINNKDDSILMIDLGPAITKRDRRIHTLGTVQLPEIRKYLIV